MPELITTLICPPHSPPTPLPCLNIPPACTNLYLKSLKKSDGDEVVGLYE